MYALQKPQKLNALKQNPDHSWQFWELISESGRQRWIFNTPEEVAQLDKSSPDYSAFLESMASDFRMDSINNPNSSDRVYSDSVFSMNGSRKFSSHLDNPLNGSGKIPSHLDNPLNGSGKIPSRLDNPLQYPDSLSMRAARSAFDGTEHLNKLQQNDGHWPGDYGGPLFLLPALVIASYITSASFSDEKKTLMIQYMLNHQNGDGGWGLHIEDGSTMFGTAMQYCALRILGLDADYKELQRARYWIIQNGGLTNIPSWGKFFMALLGVYEWEGCNSLLPELWLIPRWMPFHPGRYWCHARMVYLPMSYCYGNRIQASIDPLIMELRQELYIEEYKQIHWRKYRNKVSEKDLYRPIKYGLRTLFNIISFYEKVPVKRWRRKALSFILEYIEAEDKHTNYIDIGPVNQIINSICIWHAYGAESEAFQKHVSRWDDYLWVAEDGMKMNGYNGSQLWDTAFTVQVMLENHDSSASSEVLSKAYDFIEKSQIRDEVHDREKFFRHRSVGGWPFSTRDHGWPISDCTAEGLKSVLKLHRAGIRGGDKQGQITDIRLQQAVDLILSFQNKDGGWATYENKRAGSWLEYLNPSDIFGEIMVDYSWVECSSACITALVEFQNDYPDYKSSEIRDSIINGLQFLKKQQNEDGSWTGSWGVCYTYGTWFGIEAMIKARDYVDDILNINKACDFLVSKQRDDGGWGESYRSCVEGEYIEHEHAQVVQSSWALLALMTAHYPDKEVIKRGISFLIDRQLNNGEWTQEGISGVFNKTCMITYSAYRNVFPIWALERYAGSYCRFFRKGSTRSWRITKYENTLI
jgi:lanosterol synthase